MRRMLGIAVLTLAAVAMTSTVSAASKYKNIKVLTGKTDQEIMKEMAAWNKALGVKCTACHTSLKEADKDEGETLKLISREMVTLTDGINPMTKCENKTTCFSCHRGQAKIGKVDDSVPVEKGKEDKKKAMEAMVVEASGKFKIKGVTITCGTCHRGQAKIPNAP